jgi:nucleotide-binding universal stress UspA family protein
MYTRIMIPLDGSELAERILPYARSLARELQLPVTLLQAIDPAVIASFADPAQKGHFERIATGMKSKCADYLLNLEQSFAPFLKVEQAVEIGHPAETIITKAAGDPGVLIAMATHGRSGFQRWTLGSVADKVLHAASNHLFLIRPREESGKVNKEAALKTIVVPLDGSLVAEKVLPHVVVLAKKMVQQVILLLAHSVRVQAFGEDVHTPRVDRMIEGIREEARGYLAAKVQQLQAEGLEKVTSVLLDGYPEEEIITFAQKTSGNMVAMCSHGRSGIRRWVLGSVTERVVRNSGAPVLIIRSA